MRVTRLMEWIDRNALHPSLREADGDRLRRARLLVVVTCLLAGPDLAFTLLYMLTDGIGEAMPGVVIGACWVAALLVVRDRAISRPRPT